LRLGRRSPSIKRSSTPIELAVPIRPQLRARQQGSSPARPHNRGGGHLGRGEGNRQGPTAAATGRACTRREQKRQRTREAQEATRDPRGHEERQGDRQRWRTRPKYELVLVFTGPAAFNSKNPENFGGRGAGLPMRFLSSRPMLTASLRFVAEISRVLLDRAVGNLRVFIHCVPAIARTLVTKTKSGIFALAAAAVRYCQMLSAQSRDPLAARESVGRLAVTTAEQIFSLAWRPVRGHPTDPRIVRSQ
jgi:hypothetical protein